MTDEMEYLPQDPPPPPPPPGEPPGAVYGHWSPNPEWGPPTWPPAPQRSGGSGFRRTALALFAVACVGAGGGTAWALTTASISNPSNGSQPGGSTGPGGSTFNPNNGGSVPSTGSGLSAATIAKLDSAIVDITGDVAGGGGQVAGTGMIITSNGEVLTNNHVIASTINIRAQIDGTGPQYQVKVIGYDATDDVALVQLVGASNLPTVPIGDSSKVAAGDSITVLGNALGRGGTPAEVGGTVTGVDAQITASDDSQDTETLYGMLQVSAQIEPGDSGGPEVNAAGRVIGITTAGQTSGNPNQQQTSSTIGFAIPINKAMQIVSQIRSGAGPNIHIGLAAQLGVAVYPSVPVIQNGTGVDCTSSRATTGAWVSGVTANPAVSAGVTACGRITGIGGHTIATSSDLHNAMETFTVGQTVSLTWMDASAVSHSATVTLSQAAFPD